ncbi:unnamed protein product, partial [Trichogramma brassicae]
MGDDLAAVADTRCPTRCNRLRLRVHQVCPLVSFTSNGTINEGKKNFDGLVGYIDITCRKQYANTRKNGFESLLAIRQQVDKPNTQSSMAMTSTECGCSKSKSTVNKWTDVFRIHKHNKRNRKRKHDFVDVSRGRFVKVNLHLVSEAASSEASCGGVLLLFSLRILRKRDRERRSSESHPRAPVLVHGEKRRRVQCVCADIIHNMQPDSIMRDVDNSVDKLRVVNNNYNNNVDVVVVESPGAMNGAGGRHPAGPDNNINMYHQMGDDGLTQIGQVFHSAYQSIVAGQPQLVIYYAPRAHACNYCFRARRGDQYNMKFSLIKLRRRGRAQQQQQQRRHTNSIHQFLSPLWLLRAAAQQSSQSDSDSFDECGSSRQASNLNYRASSSAISNPILLPSRARNRELCSARPDSLYGHASITSITFIRSILLSEKEVRAWKLEQLSTRAEERYRHVLPGRVAAAAVSEAAAGLKMASSQASSDTRERERNFVYSDHLCIYSSQSSVPSQNLTALATRFYKLYNIARSPSASFDRSPDNYKNCSRRRRCRYGIIMGFVERYKISCNDFTISIVDLKPSYVKIPPSSQYSWSCVRYLLIYNCFRVATNDYRVWRNYESEMSNYLKNNADFQSAQRSFKLAHLKADAETLQRLQHDFEAVRRRSASQNQQHQQHILYNETATTTSFVAQQQQRTSPRANSSSDFLRTSTSPCSSQSVSPPNYWKHCTGQESGVILFFFLLLALNCFNLADKIDKTINWTSKKIIIIMVIQSIQRWRATTISACTRSTDDRRRFIDFHRALYTSQLSRVTNCARARNRQRSRAQAQAASQLTLATHSSKACD